MIIAYQGCKQCFKIIRLETLFLIYYVCFPARPLLFTSHSPHFNEVFISLSCSFTTPAKNRVLCVFGTRAYFVSLHGAPDGFHPHLIYHMRKVSRQAVSHKYCK